MADGQGVQGGRYVAAGIDEKKGTVVGGEGLGDVAEEPFGDGVFDVTQGVFENVDVNGLVVADVLEGADEGFCASDLFGGSGIGVA